MDTVNDPQFDFIQAITRPRIYDMLFPPRDIGLAVIILYEKIKDGSFHEEKFTERDIHEAFEIINKTNQRYPKEHFSGYLLELQEYFLDYSQESQLYFFKDYAYKFCRQAEETLEGAFNPTRIEEICERLTKSLRQQETVADLRFWLKEEFKKYEPDLRVQIDFLDRQITNSIEELKKGSDVSEQAFMEVLLAVNNNLIKSQKHVRELRSAYSETKTIQKILEHKEFIDNEINNLISEVYAIIRYINERLWSIDKKIDRIQPRIRRLFATLNKPLFSARIEKFILHLLNESTLSYKNGQKIVQLPSGIPLPMLYCDTPDLVIIDKDRELFPTQPKPRVTNPQNPQVKTKSLDAVLQRLKEQDTIAMWVDNILQQVYEGRTLDLTASFFLMLDKKITHQTAITVIFNVIKIAQRNENLRFEMEPVAKTNPQHKNIALWEMKIHNLK